MRITPHILIRKEKKKKIVRTTCANCGEFYSFCTLVCFVAFKHAYFCKVPLSLYIFVNSGCLSVAFVCMFVASLLLDLY